MRLSSLLAGPVKDLSAYIPDFGFKLYDLGRFSDEQIKGSIVGQVVMQLFKYSFDEKMIDRLPEIISLLRELAQHKTVMQWLETILRYVINVRDDITVETLQKIVRHALSEKEGEYVMTLAEKLRSEGIKLGEERGIKLGEERGIKKGKMEAIELGMVLKFPDKVHEVMAEVKLIQDMDMLDKIKDAIKTTRDGSQIVELARRCRKNS